MRWKFGRRTKPDARFPKKRARAGFAVVLLVLPIITSVVTPWMTSTASADASCPTNQADIKNGQYSWWDRNTIHGLIGGTLYIFRGTESGGNTYYDVQNSNCYGRISFDNGHNPYIEPAPNVGLAPSGRYSQVPQSINVNMDYTDPTSSSPGAHISTDPDTLPRIKISNPQTNSKNNFSTFFYVSDNGRQILPVSGDDSHSYTQSSQNANWFLRDSEDGDNCQDVILVDKANGTYKSYEMDSGGSGPAPPASIKAPDGCKLIGDPSDPTNGYVQMDINQFLGNASALQSDPNPGGPDGPGGGAGGGGTQPLTCDAQFSSSLTWIICPVIDDLLVPAIEKTDALITQQMVVPTQDIFCSDPTNDKCNAYYSAWANFRNIALGLLVAVGMVVIVAQAIGMEILDAYTVRKTLPRLLVAAIGITLSWPLMDFAVTLSNNLGFGIRDLIIAPFHTLNDSINVSGLFGSGAGDLIGGFVTILVGGGIALIAGMGILLSYLATAGLAVLVAILVLVLRQIVVIMLIIVSPIAILAYVLPNTQRTFRLWWDTFLRALLMFPMIAALIAAGRVFSAISLNGNSGDLFNQIIGFVAYFAPYFMIPLTFRFSGAAMSGVGNFVSQRAQPLFARGQKWRGERFGARWKKSRSGQLYSENWGRFKNPITGKESSPGHLMNRWATNVSDQDELLPWRLGKPRNVTNPLTGKKWGGMIGLKGKAGDLQDQIDNRAIAESQKLMQEVPMHYEGWRGASGQIDDFSGFTNRWVTDPDGTRRRVSVSEALADAGFKDKKTGKIKVPTTIGDFRTMGHILEESDKDTERLGGGDLIEHAGTLAQIKRHPDMEYADPQIAAAIAQSAAGRAEPEALASIGNSIQDRLGPGVAQRAMKAAQAAASRSERPDLRDGHGIIRTAEGKYESAFSDKNYRSPTAYGNVLSIKGSAWSAAKAESVLAAAPTLVSVAQGVPMLTTDEQGRQVEQAVTPGQQQSIIESISAGIRNPYNDPGQRDAWRQVARRAQLTDLAESATMSKQEWDQEQLNAPGAEEPEQPAQE